MSRIADILETLPEEVKEAADILAPKQLDVANWHLKNYSHRQIARKEPFNTGRPSADLAAVKNILKNEDVKEYINLVKDYACSSTVATLHEIDLRLTETMRTDLHEVMGWHSEPIYDEIWEDDDDEDLDEPIRILKGYRTIPYLLPMDQLTERQKRFIKGIKLGKNGLEVDTKDPEKAMEMLIRRQGGYTDNINSNVKGEIESTVHVFAHMPNNNRGPRDNEE